MNLYDIIEGCKPKITRKEMKDAALFASVGIPTDKKKWKVSKRAAKRKFGEASSAAKNRYVEKPLSGKRWSLPMKIAVERLV